MRVVYFGSGEFAIPSLRWLQNSPHEIARVITQPDRPAGRGKTPTPTPLGAHAAQEGLPVERCENVNAQTFIDQMKAIDADVGIVVAFGQKLLEPLRSTFRSACVNLHASLLPRWRGAAPINAAILAGDEETGVSVFRLVDRMDAGSVLIRRRTAIRSDETAGELHDRLARIGCDAIDATLQLLEKNPQISGEAQDESLATRAPKLSKADGLITFTASAVDIQRRCRAMWPWPGARCRYESQDGRSEEVTLATVAAIAGSAAHSPGTITDVLTVAAANGVLEIHSLQPAGKRLMSWQDFVNGRRIRPGDRLVSLAGP